MDANAQPAGFATLLDRHGAVETFVYDGISPSGYIGPGSLLMALCETTSRSRLRQFLDAIAVDGVVLDAELTLMFHGAPVCFQFAGSSLGNEFLVVAAPTREGANALLEQMMRGRACGAAPTGELVPRVEPSSPDLLYEDIYRLNEELAARSSEVARLNERLKFHATHDTLTGSWSRFWILAMLEQEVARSQHSGQSTALILAELSDLRGVNDGFGYRTGAIVLREFARRVSTSLRQGDEVGRSGSGAFLAVLPATDAAEAARVAERVRAALDAELVVTPAGVVTVRAILAVAATVPGMATDADMLLRVGEAALDRVRAGGQSRLEVGLAARHAA